jgi:hypothetical protein
MFFKWQFTRYGQLASGIFYLILMPLLLPVLFVIFNLKAVWIEFKESAEDWYLECIKLIKGERFK